MSDSAVVERKRFINNKNPNKIKSPNSLISDVVIYSVVGFLALICLWPFLFVASMSVSSPEAVMTRSVWLFPVGPLTLNAYIRTIAIPLMWRSYLNTIIYVIIVCVLNLVICAMAAYPLAMKGFRGRRFFVIFLMIPYFFGGGLIASFVTNVWLGLYNNPAIIILLSAFSIWNVILIRTYFHSSIPHTIKEAAIIDGAGDMTILFKIVAPLSKPIFAVVTLFNAVGMWNSYFNALIYVPNKDWQPLQLFVARLLVLERDFIASLQRGAGTMDTSRMMEGLTTAMQLKYAVIMFATLPIIFSYPFLQRYFIRGVLIGSLKE